MTQTLRRELIQKILLILKEDYSWMPYDEQQKTKAEHIADVVLAFRVFQKKPKIDLKHADPAWAILAGEQIDTSANILAKEAVDIFEKEFGFGTLPWNKDKTWEKFYKFVIRIYTQDKSVWRDYVNWRKDDGKYSAYSNRKIRENPQAFMDTGYPEFEASKMYREQPKKDGGSGYYA